MGHTGKERDFGKSVALLLIAIYFDTTEWGTDLKTTTLFIHMLSTSQARQS